MIRIFFAADPDVNLQNTSLFCCLNLPNNILSNLIIANSFYKRFENIKFYELRLEIRKFSAVFMDQFKNLAF